MILHADEFRPAVALSSLLHHGELVGVHAASADVVDFTAADKVVQGLHCFFDGRVFVEAVDL